MTTIVVVSTPGIVFIIKMVSPSGFLMLLPFSFILSFVIYDYCKKNNVWYIIKTSNRKIKTITKIK